MNTTLVYAGTLVSHTCWCGIHHAIPESLSRTAKETGKAIYCPLGHEWVIRETELDKLRRQVEQQKDRAARLIAQRDQAEASLSATKGVVTKLKKRASAGVCPCCGRTFQQLARHMKAKHPDFAHDSRAS